MSVHRIEQRVSFVPDSTGALPSFHDFDASMSVEGLGLVEIRDVEYACDERILSACLTWDVVAKPPTGNRGGRLGVVIPTLNCRSYLVKQVEALRTWLDLAYEIVVIDGYSTDGSAEYLAAELDHPRLRVVKHPKGLWQSWNAGIALLSSDYVLISTAGDSMSRQGIETLLDAARKTEADVIMSPPKFESDQGPLPPEDWPVHALLRKYNPTGPFVPPHDDLMHLTYWYGGWGWGILSSSASNLYRTRMLQEKPWPTDVGYRGDVAWGLRHMGGIKLAVVPEYCSSFNCHNTGEPRPMGNINLPLFRHAAAGLGLDESRTDELLVWLRGTNLPSAETMEVTKTTEVLKKNRLWWLTKKGWGLRLRFNETCAREADIRSRQISHRLPSMLRIYLERNGQDLSKPLQF